MTAKRLCLLLLFCWNAMAMAQQKTISGTVRNSRGEPLMGATLQEKDQNSNFTQTDDKGFFQLVLKGTSGALIVTNVGYKETTVDLKGETSINIVMEEEAKGMEDIVIVGYGTQRKASLTGAVNSIDAKGLANRPVTSVQNALQGIAPGLTVINRPGDVGNDAGTITVRGRTNLGSPGPMIIIDGIPASSRELAALNPNDIENMSVLKDAASASIYGSRAANGVIVVTTKKGATGKLSIDLNTSYGLQSPTRTPEYLGSADYARLYNEAMVNAGRQPKFTEEQIQKFESGSDPDLYPNTDWYDRALVKNPALKDIQLGVSGSSKTTRFYLSLAGLNQESFFQKKN